MRFMFVCVLGWRRGAYIYIYIYIWCGGVYSNALYDCAATHGDWIGQSTSFLFAKKFWSHSSFNSPCSTYPSSSTIIGLYFSSTRSTISIFERWNLLHLVGSTYFVSLSSSRLCEITCVKLCIWEQTEHACSISFLMGWFGGVLEDWEQRRYHDYESIWYSSRSSIENQLRGAHGIRSFREAVDG